MAHALSITNGTTTISLSTSGVFLTRYTPQVVALPAGALRKANGDSASDPVVDETIELMPYAATTTALQTIVNDIEVLLDEARQRQESPSGARVYLQYQVDGEGIVWRSEILYGRFQLNDDAMAVWGNYKVESRLYVTRRYFWESANEIELQLATSNQGISTGGRTIKNHDDAGTGDDNWVQIAAGEVLGTLPAPVKIMLTNNTGSSQDYRTIYMATNAYSDPGNFAHILEGESVISGYGTSTSDAGSSGGAYGARTVSSSGEMHWTIPAATLQDAAGRDFRIIMRQASALSGGPLYVTPSIRDADGLIPLATGDEIRITNTGNALIDLGTLPLPPGGYNLTWGALRLVLTLRTTVSSTIGIDFFQLTPTDSFRKLYQRGYTVINTGIIIDNGIDGYTALREGSTDQPLYTVYGAPLYVFPDRLQRIIVLHDEGTSAPIANSFSVRVYYRARRHSI